MTEFVPKDDQIYVVVTQTGTILSRLLKVITHAQYNHVSVSVDPELNTLYSFGRRYPYNPFWGGFVMESPHFGTFKRFSETDAVVLCIPVTEEQKRNMERKLKQMYEGRKDYKYNVLGLFLAGFRISYHRDRCYYCSEFVKDFLVQFDLIAPDAVGEIPQPVEFLTLQGSQVIYQGKLRCFCEKETE